MMELVFVSCPVPLFFSCWVRVLGGKSTVFEEFMSIAMALPGKAQKGSS